MANQVAYGFVNLADVFDRTVNEIDVAEVFTAIDQSIEEHNRNLQQMIDTFCVSTTDFKTRYRTPAHQRLQPLDEHGRALPTTGYAAYDVAWPIQMAGAAHGQTWLARQRMTVRELNNDILSILTADARWIRDHILAAMFRDTDLTFTDEEHGTLTIKPIANGDSQTYNILPGNDVAATDDHILAQANAIDNSNNPLGTIRDELLEHPENGGEVIVFHSPSLRDDFSALTSFNPVADPNIRRGSGADVLIGRTPAGAGNIPGEIYGYDDSKVWLSEWRSLPDNYLVAITTDGPRPLAIREDPQAALRGFRRVAERNDHPYYEQQYFRRAGFGAWNRVGAVVMRIGNGTYAVPTNYSLPMP